MTELARERIGKSFGGKTIIEGLDLTVKSGEMVCLLGPSGSGKTTTLRMIGGFILPDAGRMTIDHQDISQSTPDNARRRRADEILVQFIGAMNKWSGEFHADTMPTSFYSLRSENYVRSFQMSKKCHKRFPIPFVEC